MGIGNGVRLDCFCQEKNNKFIDKKPPNNRVNLTGNSRPFFV